MSAPALRVGVAGLGTVGGGVLELLASRADRLALQAGRPIVVTAISARDRTRDRGLALDGLVWEDDPLALARRADVDVVAELIGGAEGPARALTEAALDAGKPVVTANKALIALHGADLAGRAERAGTTLAFEAAVAGGIPIVKALREGLVANEVTRVVGILNGTCNYILTQMEASGRAFADVLAEAQAEGYAEADPSFDVGGIDTAHKLAILASLAFGVRVDFAGVAVEGIEHIAAEDIAYAREFGYRIKLLGLAERRQGRIAQRVHPAMVPAGTPLADVDGVYNAVQIAADPVGKTVYEGRGAGRGPTASAVVADLVDVARGQTGAPFVTPADRLAVPERADLARRMGRFYLRFHVRDEPGVLAAIAAELSREKVSIETMLQRGRAPGAVVTIVMTTHEASEEAAARALGAIAGAGVTADAPVLIRMETD